MTPGGAKLPNIKMKLMFIKIMAQELINPEEEEEEEEGRLGKERGGKEKRRD